VAKRINGEVDTYAMHIGIDASRLSVAARTGTERYSYEVLAALAQQATSHTYTLYCNGLPTALPPLSSAFRLRSIPAPRLWTHARLSAELWRHAPDVLFVPSHVIPLWHPPRSVVTIHDLGYLAFPAAHTRARRLELHITTLWSALAARRIIAISHATRADLVQHYGISPTKIDVVHHGLSPQFHPQHSTAMLADVCARYGIGAPGSYLLYVGTVQPRKNLTRLIDAFAQVVRQEAGGIALRLVIAGKKGWLTEEIERRAAAGGVAEQVLFPGFVADADLPALLSGALAFVFPSLYEGFGMPVLEAMACATPVLTSTTSALPEVAGDAALLVDPHDTEAIAEGLARLLTDAALRERLREQGMQRAAQFTWARCASETLRVLSACGIMDY
jgi:glycosyltransferase involved in cell wall biosynthesis